MADPAPLVTRDPFDAADLDPRPITFGLLNQATVGYDMSLKQVVNPDDRPLVGLYGAAAVDVTRFLLSTNARTGFFVNLHYDNTAFVSTTTVDPRPDYCAFKSRSGWTASERPDGGSVDVFTGIRYFDALLLELAALGVESDEIARIDGTTRAVFGRDTVTTIAFDWAYWRGEPQRRVLHFVDADMTDPVSIAGIVPMTFDFYYEKRPFRVPERHAILLPWVADRLSNRGHGSTEGARGSKFILLDEYAIGQALFGCHGPLRASIADVAPLDSVRLQKVEPTPAMSYWAQRHSDALGEGRYGGWLSVFEIDAL